MAEEENAHLQHLREQYRIYKDEFRLWILTATASASVLVVALIGIFTLSKEQRIMLTFVPLVIVSYVGLLAILLLYAGVVSRYCALLERKLNFIMKTPEYLFEESYTLLRFNAIPETTQAYFMLWGLISVAPLSLTYIALQQLFDPLSAIPATAFLILFLWTLVIWMREFVRRRNLRNDELFDQWRQQLTTHGQQQKPNA